MFSEKTLKTFYGKFVHIRYNGGVERKGVLVEVRDGMIVLKGEVLLPLDGVESVFWCPREECEVKK
jgi:hypothetical protein